MNALERNQLVWIDEQAWWQIESHAWDVEAQKILAHWRTQRLPFVICRQRAETAPDQVCVGLPAPAQWSRRRLALTVNQGRITACTEFPMLVQVALSHAWGDAARDLSDALASMGVQAHVYGSHGWQWLTGLTYLHGESDLDLSVGVSSLETALLVVKQLAYTQLHCRIDGEIVFSGGRAIAWRELQRWVQGQTAQVLVKDRHSIRLDSLAVSEAALA